MSFNVINQKIALLAETAGATEPIARLFISLLVAYPVAYLYRLLAPSISSAPRHGFFALTGLALCVFNFGYETIHSLTAVVVTYLLARLGRRSAAIVLLGFAFHLAYIVWGYVNVATENYDVKWTTCHCVLIMRHIGLLFDLWDGARLAKKGSSSETASDPPAPLKECPSFVQLLAYSYFIGGFLVGPLFPMARYLNFVDDFPAANAETPGRSHAAGNGRRNSPSAENNAFRLLLTGLFYIGVYQAGNALVPQGYLTTTEFLHESSFAYKMTYILIWGKVVLYKYVGVWLIAEGSCVLTGLTYNGTDENGNVLWDACSNVKILHYESVSTLKGVIESFNVNTNKWVHNYVYKRLKFLRSKPISSLATLSFLSIWHGIFTGYFVCFGLEYVMVKFENDLAGLKPKLPSKVLSTWSGLPSLLRFLIGKWFALQWLGYALVSFCLLTFPQWFAVYRSLGFVGHVAFLAWLPLFPVINSLFKSPKAEAKSQ